MVRTECAYVSSIECENDVTLCRNFVTRAETNEVNFILGFLIHR